MVQWQKASYEEFPVETEAPEGMKSLDCDRQMTTVMYFHNVEYAEKDGETLHLQIFRPMSLACPGARYPLVAYVQGSAWMRQMVYMNVPALAQFAARGFVVAIVQYRPSETAPFPAQAQDAKTAIRFMRKNADKFGVDPLHAVIWGDSSGGHTALMAGFTGNADIPGDSQLSYEMYSDFSAEVDGIVDYYGPTNLAEMCMRPSTMDHVSPDSPEGLVLGRKNVLESPDQVRAADPASYLDGNTPPLLIMHGNKDRLVPFAQSVRLFEKMCGAGRPVEFYRLNLADHGGPEFWNPATLDVVEAFMRRAMKQ